MRTGLTAAVDPASTPLTTALSRRGGAEGFAHSLTQAARANGADSAQQPLRRAAQQFVASALILPLLAQVRNDPFRSDLLHGGRAEEAFGQLLDTHLADGIAQRVHLPLVDAIERFMIRSNSPAQPATAPTVGDQLDAHG